MKLDEVLAGYGPGSRGRDGLALAVLLAGQAHARLTVATVQPPARSTPGPARAEESAWRAYLREQAEATLAQARELVAELAGRAGRGAGAGGGGLEGGGVEFVAHTHRGSGRGLVELARRRGAGVVVIGSAPGGGRGRISVGSTADQLLHSSSVPVLLAPRGYGDRPPAAIDRLTVAYRRGPGCDAAVTDAARTAAALGVPLRLVTLVISSGRRARIEEEMLVRLRDQAAADLHAAARGQRPSGRRPGGQPAGLPVEVEVLEGRNVAQALGTTSWLPGEMIICASSDTGPLRRVFLGDTSLKIVRASTCPVMILTREP
ncbi:nucleotide-binding universal stress UspA family protein [Nonomuraea thailandensis]|uniref:Nucleotide-binding universal stress UspA family protein n=1 Tax=Nonomuraea thailandensis TaxID=1188745 RepID=A0A9X2GRH9_9ACTN|nr:universal stress protein [Nonomuraea thailandensis]MCP2359538.1 nucleotide-binding universal stress UspA family protein [Nonomuraea thailandensis]